MAYFDAHAKRGEKYAKTHQIASKPAMPP